MNLNKNIIVFNKEIKVDDTELFKHVLSKSSEFSKKLSNKKGQSVEHYYKEREASKPVKDIMVGKMGEFFASVFMYKYFAYPKMLPDFSIYNNNKSWKEDLCYKELDSSLLNFHVKTCDSCTKNYLKGRESWTFQKSNKNKSNGGRDYIYTIGGLVIFVYIHSYYLNKAKICFMTSWNRIKYLLKPPVSKKLIGIKECVYSDDIIKPGVKGVKIYA